MHLDSNGNIVQANQDGGDTAQRTGFVESVLQMRKLMGLSNLEWNESTPWRFKDQWSTLFNKNKLVRNPRPGDATPPWNDPKDTSRDQTEPMIIAFGLNNMHEQVEWLKPKYFLYQNNDVASPANLNIVRRALNQVPTCLGDFWLAQATALRLRQAAKDPDDVGDDLNCFNALAFSYLVRPTNASEAALKRYLVERPKSYGTIKMGYRDPVYGALHWYCREDSGGNPEIAKLCQPLIWKLREDLGCELEYPY